MTAIISMNSTNIKPYTQSLEVLRAFSTDASQLPTGTGDAGKVPVNFGPAQKTDDDPVKMDVNGLVTFNQVGLYWLKPEMILGRTGGAGESNILFRALVNGAQTNIPTAGFLIDNQKLKFTYSEVTWVTIPEGAEGTTIQLEMARDPSGNDSGGLYQDEVTIPGWNDSSCATLQILKFL